MTTPVPTCLNKRLLLAMLQSPSALTRPRASATPQRWVRSITSSPLRRAHITFGDEVDAVLVPYMKQNDEAAARRGKKQTKTSETAGPSMIADDYQVSGYIDRSATSKPPQDPEEEAAKRDGFRTLKIRGVKRAKPSRTVEEAPAARSEKKAEPGQTKTTKRLSSVTTSRGSGARFAPKPREPWMEQKNALKEKFQEGWAPRKKLSPDAMEGIRGLHEQDPEKYSTPVLAEQFEVSPEAIRRILKSKWMSKQDVEKVDERRERWARRHDRIWDAQAELGLRPQRKKERGIEDLDKFEQDLNSQRILGHT